MNNIDYKALGLKAGVEVHQQIYTEKKMFCNCPAGRYTKDFDAEIVRHMRPTLSELGEYDGTALMEFKTKKNVHYLINDETVCTYEMDDTPPFPVNQRGLDIAIEIALLLNCRIVDEFHVIRKQYLDGSIPTGFQRTGIVGVEGWVPLGGRKVGIIQLGYEEDSCREIRDNGHDIYFNTDRLGMPLVEVVTYPDLRTPQEVADMLWLIHKITRITGKVRRGIGSVRQDVNVSIAGGTRVEIKGVPRIPRVPLLVHNEAVRQKVLLDIRSELHARGITKDTLVSRTDVVTDLFRRSQNPVLRKAVAEGMTLRGLCLKGFAGILKHPIWEDVTFEREFQGRVRVVACLDKLPNFFHSDAFPQYAGWENELAALRKRLNAQVPDAVFVTWGSAADTRTAVEEIRLRAVDATVGVPSETRQAMRDGTTVFERILPGPNRMYPDTDSPPSGITRERVENIRAAMPEPPWERAARYRQFGLPEDVIEVLMISPRAEAFDRIVSETPVNPKTAGVLLAQTMKALRRSGHDVDSIPNERLVEMFRTAGDKGLQRWALVKLLKEIADNPDESIEEAVENLGLLIVDEKELNDLVGKIISENTFEYFTSDHNPDKRLRYYTGMVTRRIGGSVCGKRVREIVASRLKA
ncbi:MAG: Glu-tRNA(Gln) amidotransferase GatDE subunit E [Planctomycetota bacterium]|nr:MAG: Glu-tRNA(Gln) amidotransferase GatDE subunit E [Planctomycetota bacterium]